MRTGGAIGWPTIDWPSPGQRPVASLTIGHREPLAELPYSRQTPIDHAMLPPSHDACFSSFDPLLLLFAVLA